jgi:hypothetical protein
LGFETNEENLDYGVVAEDVDNTTPARESPPETSTGNVRRKVAMPLSGMGCIWLLAYYVLFMS